jgi:predicted RNA methylase
MAVQISPSVADVLARSTIVGTLLKLPDGQLDRTLYASTDKVLKALGGKWDRRAGGHSFPFDPTPKIADALGGGKVVSRQQTLQLFETPTSLAARLCELIEIGPEDICLEPSAGLGRIVHAMAECSPGAIIAVEIDSDNASELTKRGYPMTVIVDDFLQQAPDGLNATAIAMNPPFTRNQDIRHVRHAFDCLTPGGRLAAIVSEHGFFGNERECVEWRAWLNDRGAYVEPIPAGAFKESGTSVATRIVVVRKTSV